MKYYLSIFGCQMNKSDSERIAAVLENAGYTSCSTEEDADLIVVIACSVRQTAVDRIYGRGVKYEKLKKTNPNLKTVLTGCVLDADKKKLANKFDAVCDIREIGENLPLSPSSKEGEPCSLPFKGKVGVGLFLHKKKSSYSYLAIPPKHTSNFKAYIPIMTGCDNFCSYCVVPYTRGREYSRPAKDILNEARQLIQNGYKEIILIGQNVNSYHGIINFPSLLRKINSMPGDFWIRFATSHPKDMSDELINTISECEKATPYIHLPIQSGSDKILKKMNRKYTKKHYLHLIKKIKSKIPHVMLSTDIIVGFPGETEKNFQETVDVFKKIKYSMAYIARYSPRPGTAAESLTDNVSPEKKARREHILTDILKQTALENNGKFLRKTIPVLVERQIGNDSIGQTEQFVNVKLKSSENLVGEFVNVKMTKITSFGLEGKI